MKLYLVPTPVGNLADMTFRGVEVLKKVATILAEDTRTTRVLLQHYGIDTPMQSYHIYNEHKVVQGLVERIKGGETMAIVTDAGTPSISDPGFLLVREAAKEGIEVECLPGATAFVPALVQSALPSDEFTFVGFLPHKKGRQTMLRSIAEEGRTVIMYESPHRLLRLLEELIVTAGEERRVCVCREISKVYQETFRGTLTEAREHFGEAEVKGEIVVVLGAKCQ